MRKTSTYWFLIDVICLKPLIGIFSFSGSVLTVRKTLEITRVCLEMKQKLILSWQVQITSFLHAIYLHNIAHLISICFISSSSPCCQFIRIHAKQRRYFCPSPLAPHIKDLRDKPIVSYVGDSVVMTCKMEETQPMPTSWNWYKDNGTDKASELLRICLGWFFFFIRFESFLNWHLIKYISGDIGQIALLA